MNIREKLDLQHIIDRPIIPPYIRCLIKSYTGVKPMYEALNYNNDKPTSILSWEEKEVVRFNKEEWNRVFYLPFKITKDTKFQWFQYRINHKIIATNDLLYKMKYTQTNMCAQCKDKPETIAHMFWLCPLINTFIRDLFGIFSGNLSKDTFIFGLINIEDEAFNNIILLT